MKLQFLVAFIFFCLVSVQAETLSLKEVLERAAETNPSLRKVYAQVKAADADLHQAYLLQNPELAARVL